MPKEVSLPIAMKGVVPQVFLFKVSLQNAPGALVKIAMLLAQYEVNILSSLIDSSLGEAEVTIISFMDFSRTSVPVEELVQELKRLDVVYDVQVVKPQIPELIINTFMQFPIILGVRCVFLPVAGLGRTL